MKRKNVIFFGDFKSQYHTSLVKQSHLATDSQLNDRAILKSLVTIVTSLDEDDERPSGDETDSINEYFIDLPLHGYIPFS